MRLILALLVSSALVLAVPPALAVNVFASVPEWGALAQEIGGDKVQVYVATTGLQDPHHVEAKPSLIARARSADLVLATGAELEVGWLPLVLQQAGNGRVQPGRAGYLELAPLLTLVDRPARLDRAEGDVHAMGDPHVQTDPRNIGMAVPIVAERMAAIDPPNASYYASRAQAFSTRWKAAVERWERDAAPLRGARVVVQHKAFTYLLRWLGMQEVAALEPRPGMEATASHLASVLDQLQKTPARMVLVGAYQSDRPARWISERTSIPVVTLPTTVGGTPEAKDLERLYDEIVRRLLRAFQ
jgi:zinc/manganese transport system substrate-binding protein